MQRISRVFILVLVLLVFSSSLGFSSTIPKGTASPKEEEKFYIAAKAFSDDFYDASFSLFKKFVEDFPKSPLFYEAKLYIAKCCYHRGDYEQSLEIFTEIERNQQKPDILSEVYYWLSIIYFRGKGFDEALDYTQRIINGYPNSKFIWEVHYLMGSCNLELGKTDMAQEIFNKIIAECSQEEITGNAYSQVLNLHLQRKEYSQIVSLGEKYIKDFPKGGLKAKVHFYLGESYYIKGEWDEALKSYQNSLNFSRNPELKDLACQGLGFTYFEKGDKVKAKGNIDKIRDNELRLFSQGIYYFKVQDYIQALETVNIFIRDYPKSRFLVDAYLNKGDLLYEMGRLNDSVSVYKYILDIFKGFKYIDSVNKARYGLAWCYLKDGKFKKAIGEFKSTLEYANNPVVKASSQVQIADAYQETGKYKEALDIYNSILKDQPNTIYVDYIQFQIGMCFLKEKELEKAFLVLKNLKNNFPSSKLIPQVQYYLAVGYFSREDYTEAKSLLSDFMDKFPRDELISKAFYLYGKCLFNEKDYDEALLIFKKIVGRFKNKEIAELAYLDMGNVYLNLSSFDRAKKVWKDFLSRCPHSQYAASVVLYLGGLSEKEGNYFEAEEYYKRVISDYKESSCSQEALLSLGHLHWNRGNLDRAQSYFERLSKRQTPLALKGKLYLAKILFQRGENQEALKLYDELVNSDSPVFKVALADKAFLLKEMKDYRQAVTIFQKAIEEDIDNPGLRFALGLCLEKVDKKQQAIEEYFKVIYAFSSYTEPEASESKDYEIKAYFRIARIYEKMGNKKEAKKIYQKIISLDVGEAKIAEARLRELEGR